MHGYKPKSSPRHTGNPKIVYFDIAEFVFQLFGARRQIIRERFWFHSTYGQVEVQFIIEILAIAGDWLLLLLLFLLGFCETGYHERGLILYFSLQG